MFNNRLKYLFLLPIILTIISVIFFSNIISQLRLVECDDELVRANAIDLIENGIIINVILTAAMNFVMVSIICFLGNTKKNKNCTFLCKIKNAYKNIKNSEKANQDKKAKKENN